MTTATSTMSHEAIRGCEGTVLSDRDPGANTTTRGASWKRVNIHTTMFAKLDNLQTPLSSRACPLIATRLRFVPYRFEAAILSASGLVICSLRLYRDFRHVLE